MDAKLLSMITKETETRTTCTLTNEGIMALQNLTEDFGLTQKMVFNFFVSQKEINSEIIKLAKSINTATIQRDTRRSLIVTKKSLKILNESSKMTGISRDIIIDTGVRYISDLLKKTRELNIGKHQKALVSLDKLWSDMEILEKDLKKLLDDDDPILTRFSTVIVVMMNMVRDIETEIEKGIPIDPEAM